MVKSILLTLLLIVSFGLSEAMASQSQLNVRFAKAKQLIESNCGDCMGGSKIGMENGINELKEIIRLGYKSKLDAMKLLASAYDEMIAVYTRRGSDERTKLLKEYKKTLSSIVDVDQTDANILYKYANIIESPKEKLNWYKKVVVINPNYSGARFKIGLIHLESGKINEAVMEFKETLKRTEGEAFENYKVRAIEALEGAGYKELAYDMSRQFKVKNEK